MRKIIVTLVIFASLLSRVLPAMESSEPAAVEMGEAGAALIEEAVIEEWKDLKKGSSEDLEKWLKSDQQRERKLSLLHSYFKKEMQIIENLLEEAREDILKDKKKAQELLDLAARSWRLWRKEDKVLDNQIIKLIQDGTSVNFKNNEDEGNTTLHYAAKMGKLDIVKALVNAGADIQLNDEGATPLHVALSYKDAGPAIVRLLLHAGSDPNTKDQYGNPPLSLAIDGPSGPEIIKILIEGGADPTLTNHVDRTPRQQAQWAKDYWSDGKIEYKKRLGEIIEYLKVAEQNWQEKNKKNE